MGVGAMVPVAGTGEEIVLYLQTPISADPTYAPTLAMTSDRPQHPLPTPPPESETAAPGSLTGYQPSLAPKRLLVPLRPKSIKWTTRGVVLVVAAVVLVADVGWWFWRHRGG